MARQETEASGLNREAVVQAALAMLDTVGVDGLSMRALADRLDVKAASLYWHLRDKDQLLELVAEAVLDRVTVPISPPSWRAQVTAACDELAQFLGEHRAAAAVVLSCLPVVQRSRLARDLARILAAEGLQAAESAAFALVAEAAASAFVIPHPAMQRRGGQVMTLAIDSGSWRVLVRAAAPGGADLTTSVGGGGAASVEVRPDNLVLVKNRRGGEPWRRGAEPRLHVVLQDPRRHLEYGPRPQRAEHQRDRVRQRRGERDVHPARPERSGSDPRQQRHRRGHDAPASQYRGPRGCVIRFREGSPG